MKNGSISKNNLNVRLSVLVPVYNEEKTFLVVVVKLLQLPIVTQIVIVDDGSTDKTTEILQILSKKQLSKLTILHKLNGGKGSAIRFGLQHVTGDYVLIQDADLEYDPDDIPALLAPITKNKAQVVYGSRFLGPHLNLLFWHRVGNALLNFLTNILYNTTLSDMETGYKLVPAKLMRSINLQSNDFRIEPEITCKLLRRGVKIYEVPISYTGRDFSEGKKITWKDGVLAIGEILRQRI